VRHGAANPPPPCICIRLHGRYPPTPPLPWLTGITIRITPRWDAAAGRPAAAAPTPEPAAAPAPAPLQQLADDDEVIFSVSESVLSCYMEGGAEGCMRD
jgi:hypothetical protein